MQALSPTDSAFLWMETRNQPMHVAGLNIYSPPAGSGPDFVAQLIARWSKHPQARAPFNLRPVLRMGLWHWEEDKEFEPMSRYPVPGDLHRSRIRWRA